MKTDVIITMSKEEFIEAITLAIRSELKELLPTDFNTDEILKMHEVMEMLHVSKPTIYKYLEDEVLSSYKVRGRRFFIKSEIIQMLKK